MMLKRKGDGLVESDKCPNLRFVAGINKAGSQLRISFPKAIVDWLILEAGQEVYLEILAVNRAKKP
jgi:hypothetical protein